MIAAVIVVGFLFWNVFSAPPGEGELATRKPQTTTVIDEEGNEVEVEIPGLSADRKEQFYTFLLVGQDTYGGGNTDTMMLAAYDVPNQKLSVMSLPRDTFVNYNGRRVLLNSVYNRGRRREGRSGHHGPEGCGGRPHRCDAGFLCHHPVGGRGDPGGRH